MEEYRYFDTALALAGIISATIYAWRFDGGVGHFLAALVTLAGLDYEACFFRLADHLFFMCRGSGLGGLYMF